jgi:hypothetical protein
VRAAAIVAALAAGLLAGCGGGGGGSDAKHVLAQTADNLGKIRSGVLHLALVVTPRGTTGRGPVGFRLNGPFSLGSPGSFRIAYTQLAAARQATVTVISTGGHGYVEVRGKTYELPPAQTRVLRSATAQLRSSGGLRSFGIGSWVRNPKVSDGGRVGGAETDRVTAVLDVVNAANGLLSLARATGRPSPELRGRNAKQLADAVRSSSFELFTGKKDRLLRRVRLEADLGLDVPRNLRAVLGSLVGAKVRFLLGVDDPNSTIHVAAPEHALPAAELPHG